MKREDYIRLLNSGNINEICYLYYLEKGNIKLSRQDFYNVFNQFRIITDYRVEDLLDELNQKFNVTQIIYNNKIIKTF